MMNGGESDEVSSNFNVYLNVHSKILKKERKERKKEEGEWEEE